MAKPITHGLQSDYALTGDDRGLTVAQRGRLVELRETLDAPGGARELLAERVVRSVAVAEWAEAWLTEKAEHEGAAKVFERGMMQRYFTASAEARRAIVEYLKVAAHGDGGPSVGDVIESLKNANA